MAENFNIQDYNYELPEERIAKFPLKERSGSKLLLWEKGKISHHSFQNAPNLLPQDALLVFNDTRVIAARLHFQKDTGAQIEVFLLNPVEPTTDISKSMTLQDPVVWSCLIGNKKRWKEGALTTQFGKVQLTAKYYDRDKNLVQLTWSSELSFAEVINAAGKTPLPPYIKRNPDKEDVTRYQTVYSKMDGAVAAPTAGLHFTDSVLKKIKSKGVGLEYLTLHVSVGTFKPVEAADFRHHDMHREQIVISRKSVLRLLEKSTSIVAVGTTSLRILESLYWYGVLLKKNIGQQFYIHKDLPYQLEENDPLTFRDSLEQILAHMTNQGLEELHGETEIYIYPGYQIRTAIGLFTNFHLPKSTLLLLISAFTGQRWKEIYDAALKQNYRFLSYGDSSLLFR